VGCHAGLKYTNTAPITGARLRSKTITSGVSERGFAGMAFGGRWLAGCDVFG